MQHYTDQIFHFTILSEAPQRIISLVPSQTELLHTLGLDREVVGITKFCVHPNHWFQTKERVGGTKQINIEKIKTLKPDLILANKEENVKEQIEELAKYFPVWVSDVTDLPSAFEMIQGIGKIINKEKESNDLVAKIQSDFLQCEGFNHYRPKAAYFIWRDPYMTVGGDTFINQMLKYAGFKNIFENKTRYPIVQVSELAALNCELLLLSSEPYPFKQKHIDELKNLLPFTKILLVDGEFFSWYGSRLLHAPAYFRKLYQQVIENS
jgi:ABC-type Fe3+-hydroxamate transport system substrate-binding protein